MVNGLPRTTGFTLLELMVVVAIVAVLAVVAAPSFSTMIKGTRIKGVASDLHMALLKARSEAVKRNAAVRVERPDPGNWNDGWSVLLADDSAVEAKAEEQLDGVSISVTDPDGNSINPDNVTYLGSGRIQGNIPPIFTVDADPPFKTASDRNNRCRRVRLGTSGIPTVTTWTCPEPP